MTPTTRLLLALVAYVVALIVVAAAAFAVVIVLAGPHAGLLPHWLEAIVLGLGWTAVLVVPIVVARMAWHRLGAMQSRARAP